MYSLEEGVIENYVNIKPKQALFCELMFENCSNKDVHKLYKIICGESLFVAGIDIAGL